MIHWILQELIPRREKYFLPLLLDVGLITLAFVIVHLRFSEGMILFLIILSVVYAMLNDGESD